MIHITNGTTTSDLLSLADVPGEFVDFADALDQGPLLPVADAAFRAARAAFWATQGGQASPSATLAKLAAADQAIAGAARASDDGEVVLWFEHDVYAQLALVQILARMAQHGVPATLTMVSIDRHASVPNFLGFGDVSADAIAGLWPQRTPIAKDALDEATAAWIALTAADPRAIAFVAKRSRALPFLAGALERWLEEFPDTSSGLRRTERQLLAAVARGASSVAELLTAAHAIDPRYSLTDTYAVSLLMLLRDAGLITTPDATAITAATNGFAITADGRAALATTHDRVSATGIASWHGGVELAGKGPMWRWDTAERRVVWR